jgi:hypothetical protein
MCPSPVDAIASRASAKSVLGLIYVRRNLRRDAIFGYITNAEVADRAPSEDGGFIHLKSKTPQDLPELVSGSLPRDEAASAADKTSFRKLTVFGQQYTIVANRYTNQLIISGATNVDGVVAQQS